MRVSSTEAEGRTGRKRRGREKLLGALSAQKLLLHAPLLLWYVQLEHGTVIKAVHCTIFIWLVKQVTEVRRTGDVDKSKALAFEVFKLLRNSGYGKPDVRDLHQG